MSNNHLLLAKADWEQFMVLGRKLFNIFMKTLDNNFYLTIILNETKIETISDVILALFALFLLV